MELIHGVHLVGSIRLPSTTHDNPPKAEDIFTETPALLPGLLKRISDGELGFRDTFVAWQNLCFFATPWLLHDGELGFLGITKSPINRFSHPTIRLHDPLPIPGLLRLSLRLSISMSS